MNARAFLHTDYEDREADLLDLVSELSEALVQLLAEVSVDGQPSRGLDAEFACPTMDFAYGTAKGALAHAKQVVGGRS